LFINAPAFAYAAISKNLEIFWNLFGILTEFTRVYKSVIAHDKKLIIPSALFLCFRMVVSFAIPYALEGSDIFRICVHHFICRASGRQFVSIKVVRSLHSLSTKSLSFEKISLIRVYILIQSERRGNFPRLTARIVISRLFRIWQGDSKVRII
jgi:hypothetical protein